MLLECVNSSRLMTTRDIQEQLKDIYGVEVSASLMRDVIKEGILHDIQAPLSRSAVKLIRAKWFGCSNSDWVTR
jgi:hypothetical protein